MDSSDAAIVVSQLTRRFGAKTALDSVTLEVARGGVHGLVGANGAGKTTLIKHILGLLRAQSGAVRVFGRDPVADPVGVLSRIGYLSEENELPGWMRVEELIRYSRAFCPAWDDVFAEELRQTFALDATTKIRNLSKGQKARAGLLIALAYRPELLLLDEPSSGLDPIVRRDIVNAVIRTIAAEGRTVLFSSHLLDEVEQVADHVTMISGGKVVLSAPLRAIKESHRSVTMHFATPTARPPQIERVLRWDGGPQEWTAVYRGDVAELRDIARGWNGTARIVADREASLDEIFVARVGTRATAATEA
ncbi:MAG TPA: ABC transporter ATP-binding protein [Thermoanaerobaculia bacterium]|nr:ABC transporter ATP-binding protein [Thermoanaerobaculia bacterium]